MLKWNVIAERLDAGKGEATHCRRGRGGDIWKGTIAVPACMQRLPAKSSDGEVNAGVIKLGRSLEATLATFSSTSIEPFYYFTTSLVLYNLSTTLLNHCVLKKRLHKAGASLPRWQKKPRIGWSLQLKLRIK